MRRDASNDIGEKMICRLCALAISTALLILSVEAAQARKHVYLLRGFLDVSTGLDQMAQKLRRRGIRSSVANHGNWESFAETAIRQYRRRRACSIVLVGHSLGADATIMIARKLKAASVPVALVVTFDPFSSQSVPSNVRRLINYYRSGTMWNNRYGADRRARTRIRNIDVGADAKINHLNIEKNPRIQKRVIRAIRRARRRC